MDFNPKVTIDSVKWERVILNVAGKITGVDPSSISFSLSSLILLISFDESRSVTRKLPTMKTTPINSKTICNPVIL